MAQRLAGIAEIAAMLGVSRQRAAVIVDDRRKNFPDPIDELTMGRVWDRADVIAWARKHNRDLFT